VSGDYSLLALSLAIVCAIAIGAPSDGRAAPPAAAGAGAGNPVVARVDGVELHRSDIEAAQKALPPRARMLPLEKIYPAVLEGLVNGQLLVEAGRKAHLDQDPQVQAELARDLDRLIQTAYVERTIAEGATPERLKAAYETYLKQHPPQEEVHARHILVPTEAEAKSIIAKLDHGADFATLAKKYSKDPAGAASGGDLGYFTHEKMVPAFADAAFALPVGSYSKAPVHTRFGWHVIKVEDRRISKPPTFEEVHGIITKIVAAEVLKEKIKALRAAAHIETFALDGQPLPAGK
jgi:peptidyl-prolyl cis-trans isomerase C